jgi:hypothetical protein
MDKCGSSASPGRAPTPRQRARRTIVADAPKNAVQFHGSPNGQRLADVAVARKFLVGAHATQASTDTARPGPRGHSSAFGSRSGGRCRPCSNRRSSTPDRAPNNTSERRPSPSNQQRRTARRVCPRDHRRSRRRAARGTRQTDVFCNGCGCLALQLALQIAPFAVFGNCRPTTSGQVRPCCAVPCHPVNSPGIGFTRMRSTRFVLAGGPVAGVQA